MKKLIHLIISFCMFFTLPVFAADTEPVNFSSTGTPPCSVTINQDLNFTIPNAIYDAGPFIGKTALKLDFTFFGEQNGQLLWQFADAGNSPSSDCSVSITSDLSFTLEDAVYDAGPSVGKIALQAEFKYFGEKNGVHLWYLADIKTDDEPTDPTSTTPVALGKTQIMQESGNSETITISGGTGYYSVSTSDSQVVTAVISGSSVKITCLSSGSATITVEDTGGETASISVTVSSSTTSSVTCGAFVAPGVWKEFDCYNLAAIGKTTNDDPFTPSWELIGGYWQWGRKGPDSSQWYDTNTEHFTHGPTGPRAGEANDGDISGWDSSSYPLDRSWSDNRKTDNEPCPVGYRVPTKAQWQGVVDNNDQRTVGTWSDNATNYSSARFFGNDLMLPAAGAHYHGISNRGRHGFYWSTSWYSKGGSFYLSFNSSSAGMSGNSRNFRFSVRCVKETENLPTNLCGAYIAPNVWKKFDCYNLAAIGKTTKDDPFTPSWRLIGGYWQWGRKGPDANQWYNTNASNFAHGPTGPDASSANSGEISGWDTTYAPDNSWSDMSKSANDPCPAGFRVPTRSQWHGVGHNIQSTTGTSWSSSATNYSSALFLGDDLMLPAAGYRYTKNGALYNRGEDGYYWSSSITRSSTHAHSVWVHSSGRGETDSPRSFGYSVRCIADDSSQPQALSLDKNTLSIEPGDSETVSISGGSGYYTTAYSSNYSVADVTLGANTITILGVSSGNITVTVEDSGGNKANITVNVTSGMDYSKVLQPGPDEGKDTCVGTYYAKNGSPDLYKLYYGGWGDWYYDFIEFDISKTPPVDNIVSAKLYLYSMGTPLNDPMLDIGIITQKWEESDVTINSYPSSIFYKRMQKPNAGWNIVDVTTVFIDWKTGAKENYGLKLSPNSNYRTNNSFFSSNYLEDPSLRPKIVIETNLYNKLSQAILLAKSTRIGSEVLGDYIDYLKSTNSIILRKNKGGEAFGYIIPSSFIINGDELSCKWQDAKIEIWEGYSVEMMASVLIHETSHYADLVIGTDMSAEEEMDTYINIGETELTAFANMYLFFKQANLLNSEIYNSLGQKRKDTLEKCYHWHYIDSSKDAKEDAKEALNADSYPYDMQNINLPLICVGNY